uniref:Si:ch211-113d22.2 n=1 Tax=Oryzias sinensis TaxID=183150 RepID=A0A8C7ZGH7_9TELE
MKIALGLLVVISLACALSCSVCEGRALKCHTCVASTEEDCNKQGSSSCPQYADACSTITGPNTVMKSCSYKAFCDKAHSSNSGAKMECCFGDDCNGPHHSHSHGNSSQALACSPVVLMAALLLRMAFSQL